MGKIVNKTPLEDMVIILPGVMGSVLQKDGKDLWAISGQAIWSVLTQSKQAIQDLTLLDDDPEAATLGDGIKATKVMADAHLVPGLVKIDGYDKVSRFIKENFQVIEGDIYSDPDDTAANFYHFPYDWRRDNRANARILKSLVEKRLKCWREQSGAQNAKVIFLAHSMGGLVARYYLEVLQGWQEARALVTFGTPHRGALGALDTLSNGFKKLFIDLTTAVRSFTSIYQLMPIYQAIQVGDRYLRAAEIDGLPNVDRAKALDALAFHREIEAAVEKNMTNERYQQDFYKLPIVGVSQPTLQSASLVDGVLSVSHQLPDVLKGRSDLGDGDGTVPQVSAVPIELSQTLNSFFIAETHGALQHQPQTLQDLAKKLANAQFSLSEVRKPSATLGLFAEDLYLPDEAIALRADVKSPRPIKALTAIIEPVSHQGTPVNTAFQQQTDQQWALTLDSLPPGLYRIAVQEKEEAISSVHSLFEVIGRSSR